MKSIAQSLAALILMICSGASGAFCLADDDFVKILLEGKAERAVLEVDAEAQIAHFTELRQLYVREYGETSWKTKECDLYLAQARRTQFLSKEDRHLLRQAFKLSKLAQQYLSRGRGEFARRTQHEAMLLFHETLGESSPTYIESISCLVRCLRANGCFEEAIDHAKRLLELQEKHLPAVSGFSNLELGKLYYDIGNNEQALRMFNEGEQKLKAMTDLDGSTPLYYIGIGKARILNDQHNFDQSLKTLQALTENGNVFESLSPSAKHSFRLEEAMALWGTGQLDTGESILNELLTAFEEGILNRDIQCKLRFVNLMVTISRDQDASAHAKWKKWQQILKNSDHLRVNQ